MHAALTVSATMEETGVEKVFASRRRRAHDLCQKNPAVWVRMGGQPGNLFAPRCPLRGWRRLWSSHRGGWEGAGATSSCRYLAPLANGWSGHLWCIDGRSRVWWLRRRRIKHNR
jgi:hypothetical protein